MEPIRLLVAGLPLSMVFGTLVVNMLGVAGYERILSVIVLTVLLSVFAHGLSALPLSNRYGNSATKDS